VGCKKLKRRPLIYKIANRRSRNPGTTSAPKKVPLFTRLQSGLVGCEKADRKSGFAESRYRTQSAKNAPIYKVEERHRALCKAENAGPLIYKITKSRIREIQRSPTQPADEGHRYLPGCTASPCGCKSEGSLIYKIANRGFHQILRAFAGCIRFAGLGFFAYRGSKKNSAAFAAA